MLMDIRNPSPSLLCKLASIIVHADELASPSGHDFDRVALEALLNDTEVSLWLAGMVTAGMAPVKR
jgi:hypothetical protein